MMTFNNAIKLTAAKCDVQMMPEARDEKLLINFGESIPHTYIEFDVLHPPLFHTPHHKCEEEVLTSTIAVSAFDR